MNNCDVSDRTLLELAAKAAGYTLREHYTGYPLIAEELNASWSPLTDDGDALRLAVKLQLWLRYRDGQTANVCWYDGSGIFAGNVSQRASENDLPAATRRAIVRAAAEIGKTQGVI